MNTKLWNALAVTSLAVACVVQAIKIDVMQEQLDGCTDLIAQTMSVVDGVNSNMGSLVERVDGMSDLVDELCDFCAEQAKDCSLEWNFDYVTRVVAHECVGEPEQGQLLVAQTIRERADEWGITPEDVVKQPNQYASPWPMERVTPEIREVCQRVLIDGESAVDEPVKWFYSTRNGFVSHGHEQRDFVIEVGNHRFFK